MKKLFLLLLTLASTNAFGARPDKGRTQSQITDPITDHVRRAPAIAQAPNAAQLGHFRLVQAQRADRAPAAHLIPTRCPMNLPEFNDFQMAPAPQAERAPVNTQVAQNIGTQTLPLTYANVQQQLLMDRATASAAAVILFRLKHT